MRAVVVLIGAKVARIRKTWSSTPSTSSWPADRNFSIVFIPACWSTVVQLDHKMDGPGTDNND